MLVAMSVVLVACTYVPFERDRPTELALAKTDTLISSVVSRKLVSNSGSEIVMVPLADGNDALAARFRMIENAERSIDIKTFLIKPDIAGTLFWLELYNAAERGVKIRLIYDDVFTSASDEDIATLDAHPNVEIRTFNPLSRNSTTVGNFIFDFARVNRRMHNKAMIVDGAMAIIGGRNIADEYYQIRTSNEFADFDLLVGGEPISELSKAFDLYWNDEWAVPIARLYDGEDTSLTEAVKRFNQRAESDEVLIYQRAMDSRFIADLKAGRVRTFRGEARVIVDNPEKLRNPPGKGPFTIGNSYYNTLLGAKSEVLVITPYFVPEDYGARVFEDLKARGVRVRIMTNSLAANNHAYVHGGYAPYRSRLLDAGVEILEVRTDAPELIVGSDTPLVLHTKLAIIDRDTLFVSSTNVDPRSIRQNTEVGMVIKSPQLANNILTRFDTLAPDYAFNVIKGEGGDLEWRYGGQSGVEIFRSEPGATAWSKFVAKVAEWLPVEPLL